MGPSPIRITSFWLFGEFALTHEAYNPNRPTQDGHWGTRAAVFSFVGTLGTSGQVYIDANGNFGTLNLATGATTQVGAGTVNGATGMDMLPGGQVFEYNRSNQLMQITPSTARPYPIPVLLARAPRLAPLSALAHPRAVRSV